LLELARPLHRLRETCMPASPGSESDLDIIDLRALNGVSASERGYSKHEPIRCAWVESMMTDPARREAPL